MPLRCLAHRGTFTQIFGFASWFSHFSVVTCLLWPPCSFPHSMFCRHCSISTSLPRERGTPPWPRHCHDRGQPRRARWQSTRPMTDLVLYVLQTLSMFRNSMPRDPDSIMLQSTPHSHLPCAGSGILPVSKWLYYQHPGTPSISRDMTRYISNVLHPALSMATAAAPSNGQA